MMSEDDCKTSSSVYAVLTFSCLFGLPGILRCHGEITQDPLVEGSEGQKVKLPCKHPQISSETIFWYRQRPNEAPRSIVSGYKDTVSSEILDGAMIITSDRKANEFSFNRVTLEDSGVYYCALGDTVLHPTASLVQKTQQPFFLPLKKEGILWCQGEIIQDPLVEGSEGQKLNLRCKHPQNSNNIFWYRQRPNEAPHSIVSGYQGIVSSEILDGTMIIASDRKANEFSFNRVTLEDSGVYYCALIDTVLHPTASLVQKTQQPFFLPLTKKGILRCQGEITQDPLVEGSEGQKVKLPCKHPQISNDYIFWYRQRPNEAPHSIVSGYKDTVSSKILDGAMIITSDRKANEFSFNRVTLEDSGVYYCALSDTVLHPTASLVQKKQ
ncbi:T cell receptor alpha variable 4 [Podarcis lilfordi]|nr:T cell receptor alpha variable 4 [Podarcis lilfordi]